MCIGHTLVCMCKNVSAFPFGSEPSHSKTITIEVE
jgi:hypothetical protein